MLVTVLQLLSFGRFSDHCKFLGLKLNIWFCSPGTYIIFSNSPKVWFNYTETFLFHVNNIYSGKRVSHIICVRQYFYEYFNHFIQNANKKYLSHSSPVKVGTEQCGQKTFYTIYPSEEFHKILPLTPIGHLIATGYVSVIVDDFLWHFNLSNALALNLSISHMYLSSKMCHLAVLKIASNDLFEYCGSNSHIIHYSTTSRVQVMLSVYHFVSFEVSATYSVVDSKILQTGKSHKSPTWQQKQGFFSKETFIKFTNSFLLHAYQIVVEKFSAIKLVLKPENNANFEVFDGPGVLSTAINPQYVQGFHIYTTSTFQCLIHRLEPKTKMSQQYFFEYSNQQVSTKLVNAMNSVHISDTEQHRKAGNHVFSFETIFSLNLKMVLLHFTFEGQISSQCSFGGLAIYHNINGSSNELSTLCRMQDSTYKHRTLYSSSNFVLVVYYFYQPYMNVLTFCMCLSTSKCKAVMVNACDKRGITVNFIFHMKVFFEYTSSAGLTVDVPGENCVVLQLFKETSQQREDCLLNIMAFVPKGGKSVHHNVTGFFTSFHRKTVGGDHPFHRGIVTHICRKGQTTQNQ